MERAVATLSISIGVDPPGLATLITDQILLPHVWRRYLAAVRAMLELSCLAIVFLDRAMWSPLAASLIAILSLLSLLALFWKTAERIWKGRLCLALSALFFLIAATHMTEQRFWAVAAFAFYLLLSAALLHHWYEVLVVVAAMVVCLVTFDPPLAGSLMPLAVLMGLFALVFSLQRQVLLNRLDQFSQQVVMFRAQSESSRESERQRIAADFHDGPLQSFISLQMRLEILRKMLGRDLDSGMEELRQLQDLCRKQVQELRAFVRSMRPIEGGNSGLVPSLTRIVQNFQRDNGIQVSLSGGDAPELEDVEASTELLQVIREALHNIQKHSNASRILITATKHEGRLELAVQDDGRGFPFSGSFNLDELEALRLGPVSIKRRVRALNGELTLESKPGSGARLEIRIPV